jgi:hypothetical protein
MVRDDRRPTDAHVQALVPRGKSEREEIGAIRHQADRVTSSRLHICNRQRFRRKSAAEVWRRSESLRLNNANQRTDRERAAPRARGRVAKAVLIAAVPPLMLKTAASPGGLLVEVFDGYRTALLADRAQLFRDIPTGPSFGFNRPGAKVSQGPIDNWWRQGMMCQGRLRLHQGLQRDRRGRGNGRALGGLAREEMEDT